MRRTILLLVVSVVFCRLAYTAEAQNVQKRPAPLPEITDPAEAMKAPDFLIQGEYLGDGTWLDGTPSKVGAQVIALGNGKFTVVVTKGGLPGDGWRRGDASFSLDGNRSGIATALSGDGVSGTIAGQSMTVAAENGKAKLTLKRAERHSSTEGAKPSAGAIVLFDGTNADAFDHGTMTKHNNLLSDTLTKQKFGDYTLHLEFRLSYMPQARGQARSNSGVYLHNCYEIQVLDSFGLEGKDNECGGFYQLREPDVNMCYPPLTWQTYDLKFTAPKYQDGKKVADARVEVKQNGVEIQPEFQLTHATPGRQKEGPAPRPIYFQGHGNKVEYRNIWLKETGQL
jgi:hypothetical protein